MLSALEADRAHVAHIEAQILALEHSLLALRIEKALAQQRLDAYKYPVLTLPSEIVSETFTHFLPVYPLCPPLTGDLSPILLTHICRTWREIALATPTLWRAITLSLNDLPIEFLPLISDILRRSGCCPLSIDLDEYTDGYEYGEDDEVNTRTAMEVFETAISHSARWEFLKAHILYPHFPPNDCPMPLLRQLELTFKSDADRDSEIISFGVMPLLRTVILTDPAPSGMVRLPWAQLTSLTLNEVLPDECFLVLQQTTNIVCCELKVFFYGTRRSNRDIALPRLKSLVLDHRRKAEPVFLSCFIVPALRKLQISEQFLLPDPIHSLASFITKTGCKLQELHITGTVAELAKGPYREAFPSMKKLSFDEESSGDSSDAES
ncbi:hypothetical protein DFH06DRAFT_1201010 [Mycena polygramma]|nr:hypothetical protein DFH06DRAFT_1201010 [Mycena polygramma]